MKSVGSKKFLHLVSWCLAGGLLLAGLFVLLSYWQGSSRTASVAPVPQPATFATQQQSPFQNLAPHVKYVGDEECAVCHSGIYRTFKTTGMGRSFYRATPDNVIEDYAKNNQVLDARSGLRYQMYRRDNNFYQLEYRLDAQGEIVHGLGRKVDYIIGSGNGTRSYLTSENGFLFEMPVTWYNQKKAWDLSPGYQTKNLRFSRPIVPECMHCHNSYAQFTAHSENHYGEVPLGIGCERCHGPGELHVAQRYRSKPNELPVQVRDSTIVNPKHLPLDLQIDVCRQCHLQGDITVLKEGKTEEDFRPGMRLQEVKSVFIRDQVASGDFRIASHGARISLSACFVRSGGKLVCTYCHNPHEPVRSLSRAFFNGKCAECHAPSRLSASAAGVDHRAESDCVSCHMRQGKTSDVPHVNFTDHWIRARIESLSASATDSLLRPDLAAPVTLRSFFAETDPQAELRLGIAYVRYFEAKHGEAEYLSRATRLLETGLAQHPAHQSGRYYLGVAYGHQRRWSEALAQFEAALKLAPADAMAHFQQGNAFLEQGRLDEAVAAYQHSLAVHDGQPKVWNNLGNALAALGRHDEAVTAYQQTLRLQPSYAAVYNNLGDLYFYRLRDAQAGRQYFEKAVRLDPNFATALLNLGNVLVQTGAEQQAQQCFERILEIDPRFAPAHGNLAVLYHRRGERQRALQYVHNVLEIDPRDANAQALLRQLNAVR